MPIIVLWLSRSKSLLLLTKECISCKIAFHKVRISIPMKIPLSKQIPKIHLRYLLSDWHKFSSNGKVPYHITLEKTSSADIGWTFRLRERNHCGYWLLATIHWQLVHFRERAVSSCYAAKRKPVASDGQLSAKAKHTEHDSVTATRKKNRWQGGKIWEIEKDKTEKKRN